MKKIILFVAIFFVFTQVINAQITKGNWLLGGQGSFSKVNFDYGLKQSQTEVSISPILGAFIFDKFAAGLKPTFSHLNLTNEFSYSKIYTYKIGPFLRYYFLSDEKPYNILLEGSYQYSVSKTNADTFKENSYSFNGGPVLFFK